jgi:hypothetical protein
MISLVADLAIHRQFMHPWLMPVPSPSAFAFNGVIVRRVQLTILQKD